MITKNGTKLLPKRAWIRVATRTSVRGWVLDHNGKLWAIPQSGPAFPSSLSALSVEHRAKQGELLEVWPSSILSKFVPIPCEVDDAND